MQAGRHIYSVKEFANRVAAWFAKQSIFADIAITGEVSELRQFGTGHLSFRLKEEQAVLECVAWSDRRRSLPELKNGMAIVATGSINLRQDRGCYQLIVESAESAGLGALFLQFEKLKAKFLAEGLFEPGRKRAVPKFPRRVALVSARGKAMEDFCETIGTKAPFVEVIFIETQVQGLGAEIEIADAIDRASRLNVDVIVLTRGGGSYEDLFPFNLEPVVRAIVRAKNPVLTAIGHWSDRHLADAVADERCDTPSLAAERLASGWIFAQRQLQETSRALTRAMQTVILQKGNTLLDRARELDHRSPDRMVTERRARLARLAGRLDTSAATFWPRKSRTYSEARASLDRAVAAFFLNSDRALERMTARLNRVDPLAPLSRGYAIVTVQGKAIHDAAALHKGDILDAQFERGKASARVESVTNDE